MVLEAGHVGQNALLIAETLGLAALPYHSFFDEPLERYLGIDGTDELCLYMIWLGDRGGPPAVAEVTEDARDDGNA